MESELLFFLLVHSRGLASLVRRSCAPGKLLVLLLLVVMLLLLQLLVVVLLLLHHDGCRCRCMRHSRCEPQDRPRSLNADHPSNAIYERIVHVLKARTQSSFLLPHLSTAGAQAETFQLADPATHHVLSEDATFIVDCARDASQKSAPARKQLRRETAQERVRARGRECLGGQECGHSASCSLLRRGAAGGSIARIASCCCKGKCALRHGRQECLKAQHPDRHFVQEAKRGGGMHGIALLLRRA